MIRGIYPGIRYERIEIIILFSFITVNVSEEFHYRLIKSPHCIQWIITLVLSDEFVDILWIVLCSRGKAQSISRPISSRRIY